MCPSRVFACYRKNISGRPQNPSKPVTDTQYELVDRVSAPSRSLFPVGRSESLGGRYGNWADRSSEKLLIHPTPCCATAQIDYCDSRDSVFLSLHRGFLIPLPNLPICFG